MRIAARGRRYRLGGGPRPRTERPGPGAWSRAWHRARNRLSHLGRRISAVRFVSRHALVTYPSRGRYSAHLPRVAAPSAAAMGWPSRLSQQLLNSIQAAWRPMRRHPDLSFGMHRPRRTGYDAGPDPTRTEKPWPRRTLPRRAAGVTGSQRSPQDPLKSVTYQLRGEPVSELQRGLRHTVVVELIANFGCISPHPRESWSGAVVR
jgi:hypothetical protein